MVIVESDFGIIDETVVEASVDSIISVVGGSVDSVVSIVGGSVDWVISVFGESVGLIDTSMFSFVVKSSVVDNNGVVIEQVPMKITFKSEGGKSSSGMQASVCCFDRSIVMG